MRLWERVKATVESRKHQRRASYYFWQQGEGSGSSYTVVGHQKEEEIYHILALIQKVELLVTCTARILFF